MVNESDTGRVIPGLPSLYQEFKLNCRFFMCVLGEGPIKPFVENVDKQKKEDDTIDLNIFNLDKPKSFRLPKRYVNFTDEELSLIISVLKDIRPMYIKSGPDEVAALLMDELSRIAALLEVFELWISEKHLGYSVMYRLLHIIYYTFTGYLNGQNTYAKHYTKRLSVLKIYSNVLKNDKMFLSDLDKMISVLESVLYNIRSKKKKSRIASGFLFFERY